MWSYFYHSFDHCHFLYQKQSRWHSLWLALQTSYGVSFAQVKETHVHHSLIFSLLRTQRLVVEAECYTSIHFNPPVTNSLVTQSQTFFLNIVLFLFLYPNEASVTARLPGVPALWRSLVFLNCLHGQWPSRQGAPHSPHFSHDSPQSFVIRHTATRSVHPSATCGWKEIWPVSVASSHDLRVDSPDLARHSVGAASEAWRPCDSQSWRTSHLSLSLFCPRGLPLFQDCSSLSKHRAKPSSPIAENTSAGGWKQSVLSWAENHSQSQVPFPPDPRVKLVILEGFKIVPSIVMRIFFSLPEKTDLSRKSCARIVGNGWRFLTCSVTQGVSWRHSPQ